VQRFIASNELNLDAAMHLIADCTLSVSSASGVAIALVEADELVYRAGSGSAAKNVGRRVPAVLIASSQRETPPEILRVENAETDMRIEAEVCRQFGASSLLMLPICQQNTLVGTLQVLFNDKHSFLDSEVRTYRLMVGVLEEEILCGVQSAQNRLVCSAGQAPDEQTSSPECLRSVGNFARATPTVAETGGQNTDQAQRARSGSRRSSEPLARACRNYQAMIVREMTPFWKTLMKVIRTKERRPRNATFRHFVPVVSAVVVISIVVWISYANYHSDAKSGLSRQRAQQAPPKLLLVNVDPKRLSDGSKKMPGPRHGFERIRVGPKEVDYIATDVTIRQFENQPSKPQIRSDLKEVNFGGDVTVRYFANAPPR
jgi:hypothetical protein